MSGFDESSSRKHRAARLELAVPLGPSDGLFRSPSLSVVFRQVRVGTIPPHRHAQTKFTFTFEPAAGVLRHRLASGDWREIPISGRHVLCTPPSIEHDGHWDVATEVIEIYLEPRFFRRVPRKNVDALFGRESLPEANTDAVLWELAGAICFLRAEPEPDVSLILDDAALIARRLFARHAFPRPAARGRKLTDEQRQRMDKFIQANLGMHFRVPQLSRAVGLSPQQFTPLCRNTTDKTPTNYVWECRLLKARELARTGKHTRRELVHLCGFADVSHLNRRFKAYFRYPLSVLLDSANRSKQS